MNVNRYLKDKAMDHIDHALGRPVDPMGASYRNHFAAGGSIAESMAQSEHWTEGKRIGDLRCFSVSPAGRAALAAHLKAVGDKNRAYCIIFRGYESTVVAESHSKARYSYFLDIRDACPDLTFKDFSKDVLVRLALRAQPAQSKEQSNG